MLKLRALESLYYLTCTEGNRTVMFSKLTLTTLINEVKESENGTQAQLLALAALRNLSTSRKSENMVEPKPQNPETPKPETRKTRKPETRKP